MKHISYAPHNLWKQSLINDTLIDLDNSCFYSTSNSFFQIFGIHLIFILLKSPYVLLTTTQCNRCRQVRGAPAIVKSESCPNAGSFYKACAHTTSRNLILPYIGNAVIAFLKHLSVDSSKQFTSLPMIMNVTLFSKCSLVCKVKLIYQRNQKHKPT